MPAAKFQPTFESLTQFKCPDWFRDAKFGIWSHWGPQSVPMFGDWYARNMYVEGSPQYCYHLRHYGHPSKFGYKDLVNLWKAENFDPDELMGLYHKAGARYFVGQAMHHDHFFNYPSKLNRFNAAQMGPKKDICGLWKQAAEKYGMPFGLTEHLGATFTWWNANKGADKFGPYAGVPYDGNDPAYRDFYLDNYEHVNADSSGARTAWYTSSPGFQQYWLKVMEELISLYQPDLLYSDGPLPFGDSLHETGGVSSYDTRRDAYAQGLAAVACLYNTSIEKHGENRAVYNQKDRDARIYKVGVLDIEKSQLPGIAADPWQTDTCIGNWFYDVQKPYKQPGHIIEMLVDIIAKNGTMLLNILQRPDGAIDDEAKYILRELAAWFAVCAEGVYGTRPWRTSGEGESKVVINVFQEDAVDWTPADFRFTQKDNTLYAFQLRRPENGTAVIKSLGEGETVRSVRLLGAGPVEYSWKYGVLAVKLPQQLPTPYANCLAIELG